MLFMNRGIREPDQVYFKEAEVFLYMWERLSSRE